jgi:hypothetical protein
MSTEKVADDDLPALFRTADKVSIVAQSRFARLTATQLGLWIIAAVLGSVALSGTPYRIASSIAGAVVLILTIVATILILVSNLDKDWHEGRTIAESAKSEAWRYMIGSQPYMIDTGVAADDSFISSLSSLLKGRERFASRLGGRVATERQITDKMRRMRNLSVEDRKAVYLTERMDNQRKWYSDKAEGSSTSARRLFGAMIASQALALVSAIIIIRWPELLVNPMGILVNFATAFLAWLQMKRHQELAQSYSLAAHDLNFAYEQSSKVKTEEELSDYVADSEGAILREHKTWLAHRA